MFIFKKTKHRFPNHENQDHDTQQSMIKHEHIELYDQEEGNEIENSSIVVEGDGTSGTSNTDLVNDLENANTRPQRQSNLPSRYKDFEMGKQKR